MIQVDDEYLGYPNIERLGNLALFFMGVKIENIAKCKTFKIGINNLSFLLKFNFVQR